MKFLNVKIAALFLLGFIAFSACKKESTTKTEDTISSKDYVYNLAKKTLTPEASISADISSAVAIKYIYSYLLRDGKGDSLINIAYPTAEEQNNYTLNFAATSFDAINMAGVSGIKNVTKRVDNTSSETLIKLTSFQPPLPVLTDFPVSILPDDHNKIQITGRAGSITGLDKIEILDNSSGSYTVVTTIANLAGVKTYNVNYTYTYRANATSLKIVAYDTFDIKAEYTIKVPATPYTLYSNLTMGAQGTKDVTATNSSFIAETGQFLSGCQMEANKLNMSFAFYATSTNPTFYSPDNLTTVYKNYYCNGVKLAAADIDATSFKASRFRILGKGVSTEIDNLYALLAANNIADLKDDGLFNGISVPASKTAKFDLTETDLTKAFNLTTASLIWVKVPKAGGSTNCLIHVKSVVYAGTVGLSTITFDMYVQK